MSRLKRIFMGAFAASLMSMVISFQAFAARIAFSDPTAEAGGEVTVNMKITSTGNETVNRSKVMLSYDPSALQFISGTDAVGDAGSIQVEGASQNSNSTELSFTLTFKALRAGNTLISVITQEVYDKDGQIVAVEQQGNSSITIAARQGASNAAELSDLQISPGTLTPAFSPDIDTYTAIVGEDVNEIIVSAPATDEAASVSVSGNQGLQLGENEIICTVIAPDGVTTKTYQIIVSKGEEETQGESSSAVQVALKTPERNITVLQLGEDAEVPEGFVPCYVTINQQEVQGWVWNSEAENPESCIFYAVNEQGERGFYRYDLTEKTLQRYFHDPAGQGDLQQKYSATAEEYNSLLHDYEIRFWIIAGLFVLTVILLITIIVLVAGRGRKEDFIERKDSEGGWDTGKKSKRQNLTKEEQYLRDLEEEEGEREEEITYNRRVQPDDLEMAYAPRSVSSTGGSQGYRRDGQPGTGVRGPASQPGHGTGGRIPNQGGAMDANRSSGQPGTGAGTRINGQPGTTKRVTLHPQTAGVRPGTAGTARGTGQQQAGGAERMNGQPGAGGRMPNQTNPGGVTGRAPAGTQPRGGKNGRTGADDDFEVIDLE